MGNRILVVGVILPVAVICVFILCLSVVKPFLSERAYLKTEMNRASSDGEYRYWERQLKKLYLRSIPFVGRFFAKRR